MRWAPLQQLSSKALALPLSKTVLRSPGSWGSGELPWRSLVFHMQCVHMSLYVYIYIIIYIYIYLCVSTVGRKCGLLEPLMELSTTSSV